MRFSHLCVLFLTVLLVACTGPADPTRPAGTDPPIEPDVVESEPPRDRPDHPAYETFDPSGYNAAPRSQPVAVEHDVPPRLMAGRVAVPESAGRSREVEGFRIQVFSSDSRETAENLRLDAESWWRTVRGRADAPDALDATVSYRQPYYRVRLGAFEFREDAEDALPFVRERFGEAFLVPDQVTVTE